MNVFENLDNIRLARKALVADGFYILAGQYASNTCREIQTFIESYPIDGECETLYGGTELRIWHAEKKHDAIAAFHDQCSVFLSCLLHRDVEAFTTLAISNRSLGDGNGDATRSRWHLDSVFRQLKVFLFLNGTTERSGPLELLPGTHRRSFKIQQLCIGALMTPQQVLNGRTRRYQRLDDDWVSRIQARHPSRPVLCGPGTAVVVDTSAIHRARPCVEGARYALTAYFR
jgi:Phytanoyl-CoA dioxygenase (PhyH)